MHRGGGKRKQAHRTREEKRKRENDDKLQIPLPQLQLMVEYLSVSLLLIYSTNDKGQMKNKRSNCPYKRIEKNTQEHLLSRFFSE